MAASSFERALAEVFGHEGGYTNNPKDPGNWTGGKIGVGVLKGTKFGIAANTWPDLDIENLTLPQAGEIYRKHYWRPVGADGMPVGVDLAVFDAAVNSGVARAKRWHAAIAVADPVATIRRFCTQRLGFMQALKTWATFGKGWAKRVARVEATAVSWALAALGRSPEAVRTDLDRLGKDEQAKSKAAAKGAAGTAAGGTAGVGSAAQVPDLSQGEAVALVILLILIFGGLTAVLLHRARTKRRQAEAYAEAARRTLSA